MGFLKTLCTDDAGVLTDKSDVTEPIPNPLQTVRDTGTTSLAKRTAGKIIVLISLCYICCFQENFIMSCIQSSGKQTISEDVDDEQVVGTKSALTKKGMLFCGR